MDIISFPFRLLYRIWFFLYFAISLTLFYPFFKFFLSRESRFPKAFGLMKTFAKMWLFFSGILMKVSGRENMIKDGSYIICANHSSFIDIPCLYALLENYFVFTGKKEIEKWPLFRIFYISGMNILVDRHNPKGDSKAFKRMMSAIDSGLPLMVFPEGTISKEAPELTEFKSGAISLAIKKQVSILPITFTSNWRRLQRKGLFKGKASPGVATVIIHEPISTEGLTKADTEDLLEKLKSTIDSPFTSKCA